MSSDDTRNRMSKTEATVAETESVVGGLIGDIRAMQDRLNSLESTVQELEHKVACYDF